MTICPLCTILTIIVGQNLKEWLKNFRECKCSIPRCNMTSRILSSDMISHICVGLHRTGKLNYFSGERFEENALDRRNLQLHIGFKIMRIQPKNLTAYKHLKGHFLRIYYCNWSHLFQVTLSHLANINNLRIKNWNSIMLQ